MSNQKSSTGRAAVKTTGQEKWIGEKATILARLVEMGRIWRLYVKKGNLVLRRTAQLKDEDH